MNNFSIFVSSSDTYADIWPLFFDLFQKYWPEYKGVIYLQTQEKKYKHDGLNIICTNVGFHKHFGATLRAGLNKVNNDNILLIMIDYIFMGKVNHQSVMEYYNFFLDYNLDSLCLYPQPFLHYKPSINDNLQQAIPPCGKVMFGYQIAFWKKSLLLDMGALPHEDPWMSEWYGSSRAEKMNLHIECIKKDISMPIPYDVRGCLHQGRWLQNAVDLLNQINYSIDTSARGLYDDKKGYKSLWYRIRIKWVIWITGLRGSYWDLFNRKP